MCVSLSFIADLRKGVDDFMGRAFYLLSTIPSTGERKSLDLYTQSGKSKLGSIKVDLRIRGLREGLSHDGARLEQLRLTRAVIDHESKKVQKHFVNQPLVVQFIADFFSSYSRAKAQCVRV